MSKASNPRRQADNEAKAVLRTVRVSPRKLDLVAATIRGKKAASAVNEDMVGHKFGEFAPTRTYYGHGADKKAKRK